MDKGAWHLMHLSWQRNGQFGAWMWKSGDTNIGTIPAYGTKTLEVSLSFPKGTIPEEYSASYGFGALGCQHGETLLGVNWSTFDYRP
ncbi:hypothetical protein ABIA33_007105 [Streptacidiphilus sp. MAP12-16]|uniref:hypothetical protein n=1 Tax=Streptacidiphilus sp. MAP12-16 TaxID=3156300 RepID=UPI0035172E44